MTPIEKIQGLFDRSLDLKRQVRDKHLGVLPVMADACARAVAQGGKILICGNGGSAGDAQHLAAELLVRLRPDINRGGIPAIPLALDSSSMTACANDYSFDLVFARMVEALGRTGDVLLALTTSGKSANVLRALETAREMKIATLGFLGGDGGKARTLCDHAFVVPSRETGRIQEIHITAGHALMELIEDDLLARGAIQRTGA